MLLLLLDHLLEDYRTHLGVLLLICRVELEYALPPRVGIWLIPNRAALILKTHPIRRICSLLCGLFLLGLALSIIGGLFW